MIKILAVGNSFSQDATALIEFLSDEIYVRNLFVGGCSLQQHLNSINDGAKYEFQHNGERMCNEAISLKDALLSEKWDYVTVQQVSGLSGIKESYHPFLRELISYIRKFTDAKIVFHRTWAYETGSGNSCFNAYSNDRKLMWKMIKSVTDEVAEEENLDVIPVGDFISCLRETQFFSVESGGLSLCRDGYHLSLNYGRLAAACVWIRFFVGKTPKYLNRDNLSEGYVVIRNCLDKFDSLI